MGRKPGEVEGEEAVDLILGEKKGAIAGDGGKNRYSTSYYHGSSHLDFLCAYIGMLCGYYRRTCCFLTVLGIVFVLLMLASLIIDPQQTYGIAAGHDHSNVRSKFDLKMGDIDHWCLGGGNDSCRCEDPLDPVSRNEYNSWTEAFQANTEMLKTKFENDPMAARDVDVAFLGESVVEEMDGRWMGSRRGRSKDLLQLEKVFNSHFDKEQGGSVNGLALGIAGDTAPNVLYRLMHGEMPDYFRPKVWWISLGMNDLGRMKCSEEVVVIGILRVVEEILEKRPSARVVINSLFPMTVIRGGLYPVLSDYKDSFVPVGGNKKRRKPGRFLELSDGPGSVVTEGLEQTVEEERERNLRRKKRPDTSNLSKEELIDMFEKERDRQANKRFKRDRIKPKELRDPIMRDKTRMRKYQPGTGFLRKNAIPLWTSIQSINKQLKAFADKHERVDFFDSTDLFVKKSGGGKKTRYTLLTDRISIRGHPTTLGFTMWEDKVVERLEKILMELRRVQPGLFIDTPDGSKDDDYMDIFGKQNEDFSDDDEYEGFGEGDDTALKMTVGNDGSEEESSEKESSESESTDPFADDEGDP